MAPSWWSLWWLRCWQGCMGGCLEVLNAPQQLWLQVSAAVFGNWHSAMLVDVRWFVQEDWFFQNLADMHWVAEWPPCTESQNRVKQKLGEASEVLNGMDDYRVSYVIWRGTQDHWGLLVGGKSKTGNELRIRNFLRHFPNPSQAFPLAKNVQGYWVKRSRKRPVSHLQLEKHPRAVVAMVPEDCLPQLNTQSSPFATFACAVSGASKGEKAESAQLGSRCQDCLEASESVCNCVLYVWEESLRPSWALWCQLIGCVQPNALKLHRILPAENGIRERVCMGWNLLSILLWHHSPNQPLQLVVLAAG